MHVHKKNHVVIMALLDCNRLCHKHAQAVVAGLSLRRLGFDPRPDNEICAEQSDT